MSKISLGCVSITGETLFQYVLPLCYSLETFYEANHESALVATVWSMVVTLHGGNDPMKKLSRVLPGRKSGSEIR